MIHDRHLQCKDEKTQLKVNNYKILKESINDVLTLNLLTVKKGKANNLGLLKHSIQSTVDVV